MTLNVTVLTGTRIFQSSDFRLTVGGYLHSDSTMKLVTLNYPSFVGLVSYTGYAKDRLEDSEDTARRIAKWLEGAPDIQFHAAVEILRANATSYINEVEHRTGIRHRLTIIAAAFIGPKPVVAVISNFESMAGRGSSIVGAQLITSWGKLVAGESRKVIITGCKPAVSPSAREELEQLVEDAGEDSARVRRAIEDLNRDASRSQKWGSGISEQCTVVSLDSSGSGLQNLTRNAGVTTHSIMNGTYLDLPAILASIGIKGTVVGASFGTNRPTTRRPYVCDRVLVDTGSTSMSVIELAHAVGADCSVFGLSESGVVLGSSSSPENPTWRQYWTWSEEVGRADLGFWTQDCSAAINVSGAVALSAVDQSGNTVLVALSGEDEHLLEVPEEMMEPRITAMNSGGLVCGSISINRNVADGDRERPAIWEPGGSLTVLDQLCGGNSGRVVSLNESGLALVWVHQGPWGRLPLVWDVHSGNVKALPAGIIPLFITDGGQVVGIAQGSDGQQKPVISYDCSSWTSLAINSGFAPSAVNNHLAIVGHVTIDGYYNPWLLAADSSPILLPTYQYHNVTPRAINAAGLIVGQASTDHEHHVLLWSTSKTPSGSKPEVELRNNV